MEFFSNVEFWLVVAFIVMVITIGVKLYKGIVEVLDKNIEQIHNNYEQAKNILSETRKLYNDKVVAIENQRSNILNEEKKMQKFFGNHYDKVSTKIKEQHLKEKDNFNSYILYMEADEISKLNKRIFNETINQITEEIKNNINKDKHLKLIDKSIDNFIQSYQK